MRISLHRFTQVIGQWAVILVTSLGTALVLGGGAQLHAAEPVPVVVAKVGKQAVLQQLQLTGTVTSAKAAELSLSTPGLVSTLLAETGDVVQAGQPLLMLDSELATLQWQSAEAELEEARIALADARRRLKEAKVLVTQKSIAATMVKDLEAEVASDRAALRRFETAAAYQKALLQRHTLEAPFAGVIADRLTELGEWVTPGLGVYSLVATDALRLDFSVAETYLNKIARNADVSFTVAGQPKQIYKGHVDTVVPVTDPNARTFLLRVGLEKSNTTAANDSLAALLPGMSVQAALVVPVNDDGVVVSRDAVLRYPDGRTVVWELVDREGEKIAQERLVRLGASYNGLIEITSGLLEGAEVVVQGNEALRHGQVVKAVTPKS